MSIISFPCKAKTNPAVEEMDKAARCFAEGFLHMDTAAVLEDDDATRRVIMALSLTLSHVCRATFLEVVQKIKDRSKSPSAPPPAA